MATGMFARFRQPLTLLLAAAFGWMLLALVGRVLPAGNGLVARYYANTTFSGLPVESGYDAVPSTAQVARRWRGRPPPAFSVAWTGYLTVGGADLYRFATVSDDGSRLFVDDRLVVDNGGAHSSSTASGAIQLSPGSHRIRLEYIQFGGASELRWMWARRDGPVAAVPAWALSRRPAQYRTVLASRVAAVAASVFAVVAVLAAIWCVAVGVRQLPVGRMATEAGAYATASSLAFSALVFAAILATPWPEGRGSPLFRSVDATVRDLARAIGHAAIDPRGFQANLVVPLSGEEVIGPMAEEAVTMLRGRSVDRYELSQGVAASDWTYQQIVATAWPRKREAAAHVRVVLSTEPTACQLLQQGRYVSLVYCP
jgi:hypothetical protein